jgi:predicted metalloprotease
LLVAPPAAPGTEGKIVSTVARSAKAVTGSTVFKVLALVALVATTASCAQEADFDLSTGADTLGEVGQGDQPETPDSLDDVVESALNDVQDFWVETYPQVFGGQFQPLSGGYFPYGPDTAPPPCGNPPPDYSVIADNAFYCPEGDLIAWDEVALIPQLANDFGKFTVGIVFAHEFGHAIQFRADITDVPTLVSEQQADCFAGAWTKWIADGNSDSFSVDETELDSSVAGMISISDLPGTQAEDPLAHGSGFDRISAFQDGYENSAQQCATYTTNPPNTVEIPFNADEAATGGNLPLEDSGPNDEDRGLLSLAEADLNDFYTVLFDQQLGKTFEPVDDLVVPTSPDDEVTCAGQTLSGQELEFTSAYCQDENIVLLDGQQLAPALNQIGDFAVAAEIAHLWARAAQIQLGIQGDDKSVNLQADCLTGFWAFVRFPIGDQTGTEGQQLTLSAGDLDEGIQGFLAFDDTSEEQTGTVFERVGALRSGFVDGVEACNEYAPLG